MTYVYNLRKVRQRKSVCERREGNILRMIEKEEKKRDREEWKTLRDTKMHDERKMSRVNEREKVWERENEREREWELERERELWR